MINKSSFSTATSLSFKPTRPLVLALGAVMGIAIGACQRDSDDDALGLSGEETCRDYCERARECDKELIEKDCVDDCIDAMSDCQADEQQQALDELEACTEESCDDVLGCSIDAGATCYFGL